SAYVRRNPLTYVCAGSSSNCSSSSARRYLPRIFVASSASATSMPRRTRASRRLLPISNTREAYPASAETSVPRPQDPVDAERERRGDAHVEREPADRARRPERADAAGEDGSLRRQPCAAGRPEGDQRQEDRGRRRDVERAQQRERAQSL